MDSTVLKTAAFPVRLLAYNVDVTIFMLVAFGMSFLIENNSVLYASCFIFICMYHALFESSKWQATPGKKYAGMKVTDDRGNVISFGRALCRVLSKFISLGLLFGGFFMIYFRADRKGLHDLICKTKVILENP